MPDLRNNFMENKTSYFEDATLMDDYFFGVCFHSDPKYIETVIGAIFKQLGYPAVRIKSVTTELTLKAIESREARLDALAVDEDDNLIDIEVQRISSPILVKRARHYTSLLDSNTLKKGESWEDLKQTFVIFITEHDFRGKNLPAYRAHRLFLDALEENNRASCDETHFIFVNGAYRGDDPIGRLMSDFQETDTHQFHNKLLAERVKFLKQTNAGRKEMSSLEQLMKKTYADGESEGIIKGEIEGRKQGEIEGRKKGIEESSVNTAARLLNQGVLSADQIAEATGLTRERILQLQTQQPLLS
jgi:predicted transposase/invertase (TIGR01784 family)